jgi:hypothetical protein
MVARHVSTNWMRALAAPRVKGLLARHGYKLIREHNKYQSETSKCRARLAPFCVGAGVDVGPGGDPIRDTAIRVDLPNPYSHAGFLPPQLTGETGGLPWFRDETLDYVYSSHVLEDFEDPKPILVEWLRVCVLGGHLVLFCPDEQAYRQYCRDKGLQRNEMHKQDDFCLRMVKAILAEIGGTTVIHENPLVDIYSWELVVRKATC